MDHSWSGRPVGGLDEEQARWKPRPLAFFLKKHVKEGESAGWGAESTIILSYYHGPNGFVFPPSPKREVWESPPVA